MNNCLLAGELTRSNFINFVTRGLFKPTRVEFRTILGNNGRIDMLEAVKSFLLFESVPYQEP